jgi:cytoskeletal protein RodZ
VAVLIRWPLVVSLIALGLLGLLGCTAVIGGSAQVDAKDAPEYRTSMSASISESVASSSAKESEQQQSATTQAVHTACEAMSTSSADAIDALNTFVDSMNARGDPTATEGPAAAALNGSADQVGNSLSGTLPQDMQDALNSWIDAAHAAATAVIGHLSPSDFNDAVTRLNDSRATALNLCDARY